LQTQEAGDGVVGDKLGDPLRRLRSFRAEPVRGPVQRAQEGARRDGGVGRLESSGTDAVGHERADAALVFIAFGDDASSETRRKGVDFEMRSRSLDLVNQAEDVREGHVADADRHRPPILARGGERFEQTVDRAVLAEEQQLVLAAEVVIEVAGRQVGGNGDVAHAGRGETARAEDARGCPHDRHTAAVGPD
jgi:hypothetical protein